MEKLVVMLASTVVSAAGWWLGAQVGFMTAFITSMVGMGVGVWGGRQLARRWLP